jgi:hypothetical protein
MGLNGYENLLNAAESPQNGTLFFIFSRPTPSTHLIPFFPNAIKIRFLKHVPPPYLRRPQRPFLDKPLKQHVRPRHVKTVEAKILNRLLSPELRLPGRTRLARRFRRLNGSNPKLLLHTRQPRILRSIIIHRRNHYFETLEDTRQDKITLIRHIPDVGLEHDCVKDNNSKDLGETPKSGGALSGAESGISGDSDADLQQVIDVWPTLPETVRKAIVAMVEASQVKK